MESVNRYLSLVKSRALRISEFLHLNPVDKVTLGYLLITACIILAAWKQFDHPLYHLGFRFLVVVCIFLMARINDRMDQGLLRFVRYTYPLVIVVFLYPETDHFNNLLFGNQDLFLYRLDEWLFGSQLCIVFPDRFPQLWINELMSFGYFSFYLMIFTVFVIFYLKNPGGFYRITFVLFSSFYLYYLIFIILPVTGPQYFLPAPDNTVPEAYLFSKMVKLVQKLAERPTGAFPSSHVGIAGIILWFYYKDFSRWLILFVPVSFLLILSTIYLKAHYVVDVVAGLLTVPLFIVMTNRLYHRLNE